MKNFPILLHLVKFPYWIMALISSFILFYLQYNLMAKLPGERYQSCYIGANLTPINILFAAVISLLAGLTFTGIINLLKEKNKGNIIISSSSTIGTVTAALTSFCTLCVLPTISIFGVSLSLAFFNIYNTQFKILSVILLLYSFYAINKKLSKGCKRCIN